ncbi:MAG: T9SS type A sorting domain-containing protein [Ignavibacteriae bacterium]|nr:T9SS type A sorting domain-containing protein [Ignavibacteriota bacterium]
MKKLFYTLAFVLFVQCTLTIENCMSQWQPDVRLTNNAAISLTNQYTNGRNIISSGDTVHVVWSDTRDGASPEIYYKRSIDGGINWGADTRITNNVFYSSNPSVAVSGSVVHIVWDDNRDGNYEIYYNRSTNGGTTWGTDTRLTNDPATQQLPCVTSFGLVVIAAWNDNRNALGTVGYCKRSSDGGISWGADTRLSDSGGTWSSVSLSGSVAHALWLSAYAGQQEIYYKRSTDAGITWGTQMALTNDTNHKNSPSMSVSGSNIHVAFLYSGFSSPGPYEIFYNHSTNGGISWGANTQLTTHYTSASAHSVIASSGSNVHVVWDDNRNSATNYEIYYKGSTNGGINWGADTRLTFDSSFSMYPFVSASGTAVHVLWTDLRNGNYEIYYKRNPTGNPIGITNISTGIPSSFSLNQNYPNPFNPSTVIRFGIPSLEGYSQRGVGMVTLKVFDITGREIQTLVNESLAPGTYETSFDGSKLTSGVYFYKLITEGFTETKKMLMLK